MATYIDTPLLKQLLSEVERKFCRPVETTTDFEVLSLDIERETGEHLSASTLKRLWGYVSLHPVPRVATLNILAKYAGVKDFKEFCRSNGRADPQSKFFGAACISVKDLEPGQRIRIGWAPDRRVELRYLGRFEFEVESAGYSKLQQGDRFELSDIIVGCPLYICRILRDGRFTRPYMAATEDGILLAEII